MYSICFKAIEMGRTDFVINKMKNNLIDNHVSYVNVKNKDTINKLKASLFLF